jgi:uncharacterized protein YciI
VSYFAVIREAGPGWTSGRGAFDQPDVDDPAAFMSALADEGILLFAGPLAGSERDRVRVLLVVDAEDEATFRDRLEADPWTAARRLVISSIEPWNVIVGADRIAVA